MPRIAFLSYDGLLEDIGQSQILGYCSRLATHNQITIFSCEKRADLLDSSRFEQQRKVLAEFGIQWIPLRYHKSPPVVSTAWDLARMLLVFLRHNSREKFDLIHARSTPPAFVALLARRIAGTPFLFDQKGFWAQQRLETGAWADGPVYRAARNIELSAVRHAEFVVSETEAGAETLSKLEGQIPSKFAVVPTCVDIHRFIPRVKSQQPFTLGFLGSFASGYLIDPMFAAFKLILNNQPSAHFKIITRSPPAPLIAAMARLGIPRNTVSLFPASPISVPNALASVNGGIYFLNPTSAMRGVSPTKLPEFLAAGVPILTGPGIGDTDRILSSRAIGVIADPSSPRSLESATLAFLRLAADPDIETRCKKAAMELFDFSVGVRVFNQLYRRASSPREF